MRILVFSDSHSALRYMRQAVECIQPDAIIHLGDYVSDGEAIASDYPQIRCFQVAGNCDHYRVMPDFPEILLETIGGIRIYMTHGHLQRVKQTDAKLIIDAQRCMADVALYGHTHTPDCRQLDEGMWVMNPGSCGYGDGTMGIIEINNRDSVSCRIIRQSELEDVQ